MTMRLKFAGVSADEGFTDIFWQPLNLKAQGNVLEDRTLVHPELRETQVRAPEHRALERLVERDALSEMLEEMSLSTLLYYVLAGEGTEMDEPA